MQHRNWMHLNTLDNQNILNQMTTKLILSSVLGAALILMMGDRAWAQNNQSDITGPSTTEPPPVITPPPNQSDITGPTTTEPPPNQSDVTGPSTTNPPPLAPESETRGGNGETQDVLEIATELSSRLQRARLACTESRQAVADLPRRFARGTVDANVICSSLECEEFRVVTQEVQSFLDSLDQAQIQQLQQRNLRLW
ncbi:MAG TPA: hypothetical protein V6C65_41870 [Allocoleopsis sp.]